MKILAINSSLRGSHGVSAILLNKLFEGAKEQGAECETVHLSQKIINRCTDCQLCQTPDHLLRCRFDDVDDVKDIFNKMRQADLIIYATPVYTIGMSSLLKTLFERFFSTAKIGEFHFTKSGLFFHNSDQNLCQKPFSIMIVYDNIENEMSKNIVTYFDSLAKFSDSELVGTLIRKSAGMFNTKYIGTNNADFVARVFQAYIQAGRELVTCNKISKATEKKANKSIVNIPFFVKPMLKLGIGKDQIAKGHAKMMQSIMKRD